MSTVVLALTLLSLLTYSNAALNNVAECPTGCECNFTASLTERVQIDCTKGIPNAHMERLSYELNSLFSVVDSEDPTSLNTTYESLARVPPSDSQLQYLNMMNVTECPTGCKCEIADSLTALLIDCRKNSGTDDMEQQFREYSVLSRYVSSIITSPNTTYIPPTAVVPFDPQLQNVTMLFMLLDSNTTGTGLSDSITRFTELPKLESFWLVSNGSDSLQDETFHGLHTLRILVLILVNASGVLQNGLFDGLRSLEFLVMYLRSPTVSFQDGLFDGLQRLTTLFILSLSHSTVSLQDGLFDDLQRLTTLSILSLSHSPVSLQDGLFDDLQSLVSLYLEYSSIGSLPDGLFHGLKSLEWLVLSHNSVVGLHAGLFDDLHSLTHLDLSHNSIVSLQDGLFDGLPNLTFLDLSYNQISFIGLQVFSNAKLTKLETLSLSNNSIASLQDGLFDHLRSLDTLDLSHNQISFVGFRVFSNANLAKLETLSLRNNLMVGLQDGLFDGLQGLVNLDLSYNSIVSLQNGLFDGLQNLVSLNLTYNQISFIGLRVFSNGILPKLKTLSLSYNSISSLPNGLFSVLSSLETLDLQNNNISFVGLMVFSGAPLEKLETLLLNGNSIVGLQDGHFDRLNRLKTLDLHSNSISFIGLRLFSSASDWTNLRSLDLSHNRLTSLEPWWHVLFRQSRHRPSIVLNNNFISHFTNKMEVSIGCSKYNNPSGYLDLSYNSITRISDIFIGWNIAINDTLKCLLGNPHFTLYIAGDFHFCDCVDFPIFKMAKMNPRIDILQDVHCTTFRTKSGQPMLASSIPLIDFICERPIGCPKRCQCAYRPGNYTLHVHCSAANLSSFPRNLPPLVDLYENPNKTNKYKLDFSSNKLLRRLEHRPYFDNTSILDVSKCGLTEITVEDLKFVSCVSIANFRGNLLQSFPREADNVNISTRLLLGLNAWECSCDNSWMIEWLQSLRDQLLDPGDIICKSPARMYGKIVLQSTEYDFCVDPVQRTLKITLSTVAPIFAIAVTLVTVVLLSYKLREKCYRRWKFHPFDRDECMGEDMNFDVFLCCSSEDHNPHGLHLLELIESKGYRVCYHLRDFLAGGAIADNMIQAIERSKRTVCLLSNNFLQSYFCMTEFEMAYHHNVVVKRKKRLIVLMTLDNPTDLYANDASDMTTLRQYLRQYTYIDYTTDDWLDKLLYALPLRGLLQPNEQPQG